MQIHRDLLSHSSLNAKHIQGGVVTLGNFDGVHLGHQALINAIKQIANTHDLKTHVVSFTPHPRTYFSKQGNGLPSLMIGSVRDRIERLNTLGIDHLHLLRFNHTLATLNPQTFVKRVLIDQCHAQHIVVGRDVRFGYQRQGDAMLLNRLGYDYGFKVHYIDDVIDNALIRISSSMIRHDLDAGHIINANQSLGYDYSISSRVIHGRQLGRSVFDCPTLNFNPHLNSPALKGIMVVAIDGLPESNGQRFYGVASLGLRPTVEHTNKYSLEVHVFDWSGDAYGHRVTITYLHKLRDEVMYVDINTLKQAIHQDIYNAKLWLSGFTNK